MNEPNLVSLTLSAFVAVLAVLSFLAVVIHVLAYVFRARSPAGAASAPAATTDRAHAPRAAHGSEDDAALMAALHAVIARRRPGECIVRIDETTARRGR
jgi:Na+-transporting methylmalonyl-CoA/oxaloacetate decarboxylase gamma subunit